MFTFHQNNTLVTLVGYFEINSLNLAFETFHLL